MSDYRTLKLEDWEREGRELFGEDKYHWRFRCPACKREWSINEALKVYPRLKGRGWNPTSECLGRYADDIDCDWAAYGLFRGPWIVKTPEGQEVAAFPFGKPKAETEQS